MGPDAPTATTGDSVTFVLATGVVVALLAAGAALASRRLSGLDLLSAVTPRRGYARRSVLAYAEGGGPGLDVYEPKHPRRGAAVIVFFHGGGWRSGRRSEYRFVGQAFASAGYTVVIPDYRVYPAVRFPGFVEDAAQAVGWTRRSFASRPMVLMGHSAGAHIAALLVLDRGYLAERDVPESALTAMVGLSGPYDFLPLTKEVYQAIFPEPTRPQSQPINFVDRRPATRLFLLTGDGDKTVDPGNSTRLAEKVRAKGGEARVKVYPRTGHLGLLLGLGAVLPIAKPPVRADILDFLGLRGE
jgi:acetyl esterase/lipase